MEQTLPHSADLYTTMDSRIAKRPKLRGEITPQRVARPSCAIGPIGGSVKCGECDGRTVFSQRGTGGIAAEDVIKLAVTKGGVCPHVDCGRVHCKALMAANQSAGSIPVCLLNANTVAGENQKYFWQAVPGTEVC